MNKESKKHKKVVKSRKRRTRKKKILENERFINRLIINITKLLFLEEKKKYSKKIIETNQRRATELRRILDISEKEVITLTELEKRYKKNISLQKNSKNKVEKV